jgi:hypothetical protein
VAGEYREIGAAMARNPDPDERRVVEELTREVQEAAKEAAAMGYPRLALLMEECRSELAEEGARRRWAVEQRVRKALAVWSALRTFPLPHQPID